MMTCPYHILAIVLCTQLSLLIIVDLRMLSVKGHPWASRSLSFLEEDCSRLLRVVISHLIRHGGLIEPTVLIVLASPVPVSDVGFQRHYLYSWRLKVAHRLFDAPIGDFNLLLLLPHNDNRR